MKNITGVCIQSSITNVFRTLIALQISALKLQHVRGLYETKRIMVGYTSSADLHTSMPHQHYDTTQHCINYVVIPTTYVRVIVIFNK